MEKRNDSKDDRNPKAAVIDRRDLMKLGVGAGVGAVLGPMLNTENASAASAPLADPQLTTDGRLVRCAQGYRLPANDSLPASS